MPKTTKAVTSHLWRNRIVGTGLVPASELLANEDNWREHPAAQKDALRMLIGGGAVGWIQSVIVNKRTDASWGRDRHVETMIDGHLRTQLALAAGDETPVPVTYVDLTKAEEKLALASFDKVTELAHVDDEKYDMLLAGLAALPNELTVLLARRKEKKKRERRPCRCCLDTCVAGCACHRDQKER